MRKLGRMVTFFDNKMDLDKQDKKIALTIIELEMFVQTLICVVHFAVGNHKSEFMKKLREMVDAFPSSLSETERGYLQKEIDAMIEKKTGDLLTEMEKELSHEEAKKILNQLVSPS